MVQDEILEASRGHMTEMDSECSGGCGQFQVAEPCALTDVLG